ncbi:MAG TPA: S41 family peptidase [Steroidobacteraceae bacterium]|nr:S41 family peptidase [Steroidobacteraceae bacterium]
MRTAWRLSFCAAVLCALSPALAQQVTAPATPAGHVLSAWLGAFNSADQAQMNAFAEQYKPQTNTALEMPFRMQTGGFDLLEVRKSEPTRIEVLLKEHSSSTQVIARLISSDSESPQMLKWFLIAVPPGVVPIGFQIDAETRNRVIDGSIKALNDSYVYPNVTKAMEKAVRQHQRHGDYDSVYDGAVFADQLTDDLRAVSHDKHLSVRFSPVKLPENFDKPDPERIAQGAKGLAQINCGFERVERLPENIGYVKFNQFAMAAQCAPTANAAMGFLANVRAIIFDLRDNGGGDPTMVALICSYLFDGSTHLNDLVTEPGDVLLQSWTVPYLPGKRLADVPAFVLVSSRTFSGAEEFSYDLQSLKRATIVGETTAGGAHLVRPHRLDDRFSIGVPFGRAINPITKTDWEGTGVIPDVKVAASEALTTAQKLAHEKLTAKP